MSRAVADAIVRGDPAADEALDALYPAEFRRFRAQHATPVDVALRASAWLAEREGARVLDYGAGAGRFCVVGALATPGTFVGVERRAWLVDAARDAAARLGASRAEFVHGDVRDVDPEGFDGFYLFNPFAENYLPSEERIDDAFVHDDGALDADVEWVEAVLAQAPEGTRVVTYNGFGGVLDGYASVRRERGGHSVVECWLKRAGVADAR